MFNKRYELPEASERAERSLLNHIFIEAQEYAALKESLRLYFLTYGLELWREARLDTFTDPRQLNTYHLSRTNGLKLGKDTFSSAGETVLAALELINSGQVSRIEP